MHQSNWWESISQFATWHTFLVCSLVKQVGNNGHKRLQFSSFLHWCSHCCVRKSCARQRFGIYIDVNIICSSQSTKSCLEPAKLTHYYILGTAQFQTEVLLLSVASIRILFHQEGHYWIYVGSLRRCTGTGSSSSKMCLGHWGYVCLQHLA